MSIASRTAFPPNSSNGELGAVEEVASCELLSLTINRFPVRSQALCLNEKAVERVGDTPATLHTLRFVLIFVLLAPLAGCRSTRHALEPYRSDPEAAATLESRANESCELRRAANPPHTFISDGCSMFPDSDWAECCVAHDIEYWCGGTAIDRHSADSALRDCVARTGRPTLGWWMEKGVRMGGVPWTPTSWRWGYGWDWPTCYESEGKDGDSSSP